jgi:starvation-inducible DNA-binding protein
MANQEDIPMKMFASPSALSENARREIVKALDDSLVDGIDLQTQAKVAHWNVKGPFFAVLHPLFDTLVSSLIEHNDAIAERAVTLGGLATATARRVGSASRLRELPSETTHGGDLVRLLAERFEQHLQGLRGARAVAEKNADPDTVDLLTEVVSELEKQGWMLRATLEA